MPHGAAHLSDVDALRSASPAVATHDVFVCGPDGWADLAQAAVRAAGVPDGRVRRESFAW